MTKGAVERDLPVLGICGGQQLLNVVLGGTLIQHIPDAVPEAWRTSSRTRAPSRATTSLVAAGTLLHRITGVDRLPVNSAHHQAAERVGQRDRGQRHGRGRRDRGDRGSAASLLPRRAVAPEYGISPGDRR